MNLIDYILFELTQIPTPKEKSFQNLQHLKNIKKTVP